MMFLISFSVPSKYSKILLQIQGYGEWEAEGGSLADQE